MTRIHLLIAATGMLSLLAWTDPASGQPTQPAVITDSSAILRASLLQKREDRARMDRMLTALNNVDTVYKKHCPTWIVLDEDLKQRVLRVFHLRYPGNGRDTDVVVVSNPEGSQILELSAGTTTMGQRDVRVNLSDSLRQEILFGPYPRRVLDPNPPQPRNPMLFGYTPRFAALSLSAFTSTLLFNNGLGLEARLGYEEIGYHFWSAGALQVLGIFDRLKLGIVTPLAAGNNEPSYENPLGLIPRKLTGGVGVATEYTAPLLTGQIEFDFKIDELRSVTNPNFLADPDTIYSVHTLGQVVYGQQELVGGGKHLFTLRGGLGYHQVTTSEVRTDGSIVIVNKDNYISPIVGIEYVHQGERLYGVGIQYYSSIIFAKCWFELVKNFIFVDLKYYAPIFRDPKPWEQPYFFMISPRIQVIY